MTTTQIGFQNCAAPVRPAVHGYRILRRIVALRCAGPGGIDHADGIRPAATPASPLAAE